MKPERWDEVDQILQSVLERAPAEREAYLAEACSGDEDLRREVMTLMASHESAESFMAAPALQSRGDIFEDEPKLNQGDVVGPYRITKPIGRGGMGEVYLAEHTTQSREVALKILPAHFLDDHQRVQRFRQEARAVLALNHPNVVTVYDIGESAGVHFISTEFVEGQTLRERMASARLTIEEAVEIVLQVASALAYAHEKGVIHRDVKPENIMLRPDGYVKVLDFGIAKLTERQTRSTTNDPKEAPTRMKASTTPGMVMGTVHYMSPEQARGLHVDERTDTWSLGVILYEMLCGHQPFEGETPSDVISVILQRDPAPLSTLLPDVPPELERITSKALDKSKDERYQTAKDFHADLRRFKRRYEHETDIERSTPPGGTMIGAAGGSTDGGASTTSAAGARQTTSSAEYIVGELKRHRKGIVIIVAALVAVTVVGLLTYRLWKRSGTAQPTDAVTPAHAPKLTPLPMNGIVYESIISPDGKYVVYKLRSDAPVAEVSLWVKHLPTNSTVQILPPTRDYPNTLYFSGDSNYIYYGQLAYDTKVWSVSKVSVLGGVPKKLIEKLWGSYAPSPDGKQMAFSRLEANGEQKLLVANEDGTGERVLATRNKTTEWASSPAWSPDRKNIAIVVRSSIEGGYNCSLLIVNVVDGAQRQLGTMKWIWATDLVWLGDGSGLIASVGDGSATPRQVWYVSYPDGAAHRITNDLNDYLVKSATADGKTLLAVQMDNSKDVWVGPVSGDASQLKQVTFAKQDEIRGGAWTPDGKIVFSSVAGVESLNLWMMNADGSDRRQITSGEEYDYNPATSPDGRVVFFASRRNGGTPHIWRIDMNGSNLKQLTFGDFADTNPSVTPDGQWVLFNSPRGGTLSAWKLAVDGGEPVQLSKSLAVRAISPDGKLMACWDNNQPPGARKIFILPVEGGEPTKVLELPGQSDFVNFGWTADGRAITYPSVSNGADNIGMLPLDGGRPAQLTHFKGTGMDNFDRYALSRDGKQLAVTRVTTNVSLVLITDFK
jgi:serine/threonine protein kinase/dipeptidyl aminopeptidase/acylaminoacyl peptidase